MASFWSLMKRSIDHSIYLLTICCKPRFKRNSTAKLNKTAPSYPKFKPNAPTERHVWEREQLKDTKQGLGTSVLFQY